MHNKTILPRGAAIVGAPPPRQLTGSFELFVMGSNGGLQPARPMMQMMLMTAATTAAEERGGSSDRIRTGITPPLSTRDISGEKSDIIPHTGKSSDAAPSE